MSKETKKICIAIDLNGVILGLSLRQIASTVLKSGQIHRFMILGLNPRFWHAMIQHIRQEPILEQAFDQLVLKFPQLKNVEATAFAIINAQQPKKGMVCLLEQLRADGHTLVAFSNIGPKSMATLRAKHPDLFALFHDFVTPTSDFMIGKPDKRAYQRLFSLYGDTHNQIILIDDQKVNIHAAQHHGITGIQYKSAKQIDSELKRIFQK